MSNSPVVLVHGAWFGSWVWHRVAAELRVAGCSVFAPSLTGLGERRHLLTPAVNLSTHIDDVAGLIDYEDLTNLTLVGWSYGSLVTVAVADRFPDRIARLIYLDAFVPDPGQSIQDLTGAPLAAIAREDGEGWLVPPLGDAASFDVSDPADAAFVNDRLGPQPLASFLEPVTYQPTTIEKLDRTFILTSEGLFEEQAERAANRGFKRQALPNAGHCSMLTQPKELANLLASILA